MWVSWPSDCSRPKRMKKLTNDELIHHIMHSSSEEEDTLWLILKNASLRASAPEMKISTLVLMSVGTLLGLKT